MAKWSTRVAVCAQLIAVLFLMGGCGSNGSGGGGNQNNCTTATGPTLPTLTAPNGTVGVAYTFTSGAISGGTAPFTVSLLSGTLPPGLTATVNSTTVTLSGTPTAAGTYTGTIQVSDGCSKTTTGQVTITINAPLMVLPVLGPPNATLNQAYSFISQPITGGTPPFTVAIGTGTLPAGLTLAAGAGNAITITGTPTALSVSNFTIRVTDSGSPAQIITTAQITMSVVNLQITTQFVPNATNAQAGYSSTLGRSGGTGPFTWSLATGTVPAGMTLGASTGTISGTPTVTGPVAFTVRVTDSLGASTTQALVLNVLPELPRVFLDTSVAAPTGGSPINLTGGTAIAPASVAAIQTAVSAAPCGAIINLRAGDYWAGSIKFPRHVPECDAAHPITVTSDAVNLPPPGTRVTPADAPKMPKIYTNLINTAALDFSAQGVTTAQQTLTPGGSFFRIVGVEVSLTGTALTTGFDSALINIGVDETLAANMPHDIIIDRCFIHGIVSTGEVRRGILMNGVRASVIDSNISEIHQTGSDSQAIAGWNGPGPFKIQNNRLEASSENINFGGSIGSNNGGDNVVQDMEVRNNYILKPLSWQAPDLLSGKVWLVKNLMELKNGVRVLITGNVFENSWAQGQVGYALLLTPRGPGSAQGGPNDAVKEITVTNNLMVHVGGGINMSGDDSNETGGPVRGQNFAILNNVVLDANQRALSQSPFGAGVGANAAAFQLLDGVRNVTLEHNTAFATNTAIITSITPLSTPPNRPNSPSVIDDNVFDHGAFGVFCGGLGIGSAALNGCFQDPLINSPTFWFLKNLLINLQSGVRASDYPATNQACDAGGTTCFPASVAAAGVTDPANCNAGNFDFHACILTQYSGAGTDGRTLGADMSTVIQTTSTNPVRP